VNIQEYIESGVLETYVLGIASEEEANRVLYYKDRYPQVQNALFELETDMEDIALQMAIAPPPGTWTKIEESIDELTVFPEVEPIKFKQDYTYRDRNSGFIEVESQSSEMRVHKNWKWALITIFVLGKIFLGCAIYFYLENRQAQQQIQELKTELHKTP
jgi:hypothetical protein